MELIKWKITQQMVGEWKINARKQNINKQQILNLIQAIDVNHTLIYKTFPRDAVNVIHKIRNELGKGFTTIIVFCKTIECNNPHIVLYSSENDIDYLMDTHTDKIYNSGEGLSELNLFLQPYINLNFIYKGADNTTKLDKNVDSLTKLHNRNTQRKTLRKTHNLSHISTPELIHFICSDSGTCMAFGVENDKIKQLFNNFIDFKYASPTLKRIGEVSANGFVTQIEYKNNNYKSYAILKSSLKPNADNLYYEFLVGKLFINKLTKKFPCFLETYGSYIYNDGQSWKDIKNIKRGSTEKFDLTKMLYLNNNIDETVLENSCLYSQYFSILIENIKEAKSLRSYLSNIPFLIQELGTILYQIYMPLSQLSTSFTHYDLHDENVLIYKPFGENSNKYITFHYHFSKTKIITFKSKYMVKIIDYGRSFFHSGNENSYELHEALCEIPDCNENNTGDCGENVGFGFLNEPTGNTDNHFITPVIKNISHDLRLLRMIYKNLYRKRESLKDSLKNKDDIELDPFKQLYTILENTIYKGEYGTPEKTISGLNTKIHNIQDGCKTIEGVIHSQKSKNLNNTVYNDDSLNGGDLHIYTDKNMKFIPYINKIKSLDKSKSKIKYKTLKHHSV